MTPRGFVLVATIGMQLSAGCAFFVRPVPDGASTDIRGAVVELAPDHLDVRTKPGYVFRVALDGTTLYQARDRPASPDCAAAGTRVRVTGIVEGGVRRAKNVSILSGRCLRDTAELALDGGGGPIGSSDE